MKKQIPNLITLCNLLCGAIATLYAAGGHLTVAATFILLGIIFDFFDGMTARLLRVSSPIGKELDSLADVVTSGVAPGFILFSMLDTYTPCCWLKWTAMLIPAFSAYRLAKFNLDTRQTHSFLGLPTPANALIWAALGIAFSRPDLSQIALLPLPDIFSISTAHIEMPILAVLSLLLDIALVSEIPLFALKFKNLSWGDNLVRFVFLLSCLALILLFGLYGIVLSILWYVILSLLTQPKATAHE